MAYSDGEVGAMAMLIAKSEPGSPAPRLLTNVHSMEKGYDHIGYDQIEVIKVQVPLDFYDSWDSDVKGVILKAARHIGHAPNRVNVFLAPESDGWRDRLAQVEDWGPETKPSGSWEVIDERLSDLKGLLSRAVTPDDLADVGRRCRDLLIAAANATFRPSMVPEGKEPPKESDAKAKCTYIVASVGEGSADKRLVKLIDRAWELASGLLHDPEPPPIPVFTIAQATILVVRTLERIESRLDE